MFTSVHPLPPCDDARTPLPAGQKASWLFAGCKDARTQASRYKRLGAPPVRACAAFMMGEVDDESLKGVTEFFQKLLHSSCATLTSLLFERNSK
jgi:hypothetical protein